MAGGFDRLERHGGGSTIQGLVVNNWAKGIHTFGPGGNVIRGNFLGTDPTGTAARPNSEAIELTAPNDRVGGTSPGDRNLVSGNTSGVFGGAIEVVSGTGAVIQGNLVGTDASGALALPNADGIYTNVPTTIGGTEAGAGNVISGNSLDGMFLQGDTLVQGNRIGTTADGTGPVGNGQNGINYYEAPREHDRRRRSGRGQRHRL